MRIKNKIIREQKNMKRRNKVREKGYVIRWRERERERVRIVRSGAVQCLCLKFITQWYHFVPPTKLNQPPPSLAHYYNKRIYIPSNNFPSQSCACTFKCATNHHPLPPYRYIYIILNHPRAQASGWHDGILPSVMLKHFILC